MTTTPANQQFCLRWNNYQTNLTQVFDQLLKEENFVDVTLSCEGTNVKAHRMVLSACSPYFQELLCASECSHPVIILQGVRGQELKAIVEFMYKGEISISQDSLASLLRVAESLKIRGLADVGEGEAEAILTSPTGSPKEDDTGSVRKRLKLDRGADDDTASATPSPSHTPSSVADIFDCGGFDLPLGLGRGPPLPSSALASSLSSLAAHLPGAMPPPGPPGIPTHLTHIPPLSPLLNMQQAITRHHSTGAGVEDFEIRPGIAEMIREEERAKLIESSHHWMGSSMADSYQAQVQAAWQKSWNQTQSLLQNLRFRERGPLKSWRPETMAEAIHAVLREGLSLSQAARKYDIPYPTFVLYANRVHNLLGPSREPGDMRPKGRGRPQRILLGTWPEDQIKGVIRAVVFRDTSVFRDEHKENKHPVPPKPSKEEAGSGVSHASNGPYTPTSSSAAPTPVGTPENSRLSSASTPVSAVATPGSSSSSQGIMSNMLPLPMTAPGLTFPPIPGLNSPVLGSLSLENQMQKGRAAEGHSNSEARLDVKEKDGGDIEEEKEGKFGCTQVKLEELSPNSYMNSKSSPASSSSGTATQATSPTNVNGPSIGSPVSQHYSGGSPISIPGLSPQRQSNHQQSDSHIPHHNSQMPPAYQKAALKQKQPQQKLPPKQMSPNPPTVPSRQIQQQQQHLMNMMSGGLPTSLVTTFASPHMARLFGEAGPIAGQPQSSVNAFHSGFVQPPPQSCLPTMNSYNSRMNSGDIESPESLLFGKMTQGRHSFNQGLVGENGPPSGAGTNQFENHNETNALDRTSLMYRDGVDSIKSEPIAN